MRLTFDSLIFIDLHLTLSRTVRRGLTPPVSPTPSSASQQPFSSLTSLRSTASSFKPISDPMPDNWPGRPKIQSPTKVKVSMPTSKAFVNPSPASASPSTTSSKPPIFPTSQPQPLRSPSPKVSVTRFRGFCLPDLFVQNLVIQNPPKSGDSTEGQDA